MYCGGDKLIAKDLQLNSSKVKRNRVRYGSANEYDLHCRLTLSHSMSIIDFINISIPHLLVQQIIKRLVGKLFGFRKFTREPWKQTKRSFHF